MPTSDYPIARQLHADRTARLQRSQRSLHLPALVVPSLFRRRPEHRITAKPATTC